MQSSVNSWCSLLNSTGGAAKPEKCFWWLADYECEGGNWKEAGKVDWTLTVPVPSGREEEIKQLDIFEATDTLGV